MMMSTIRVKFVKKMEGKRKNYFSLLYFWHISLWVHPNFEFWDSLDVEFNSASNPYPHCILLRYPRHPKMKISLKKTYFNFKIHFFYWNFHFWVPWVQHKYAEWVSIGCIFKCRIQLVPKIKIWVNR